MKIVLIKYEQIPKCALKYPIADKKKIKEGIEFTKARCGDSIFVLI